jgi:iron(III) transport system ATP-binding protein
MPASLTLHNIDIALGGTPIVRDVSFDLAPGEIGCLLGPSGCGKTTLLRSIAGFEQPTGGEIRIDGIPVASATHMLPPERRKIGMVFQDLALFPHLSVAENIAFGMRGASKKDIDFRVAELLHLVGLEHVRKSYPHQLSGGQQQRIALIRAMAPRPRILLLDEPFSSQDVELREQLAHEVRKLLLRDGITALLVTHDQHEAFAMADRIGVVNQGRLVQWDTAYRLYHEPATRFVADFIGQGVLLCGAVIDEQHLQTELGVIAGDVSEALQPGQMVDLLVRPDDVLHDDTSAWSGTVMDKTFRGSDHLYTLRLPGSTRLLCLAPSHHDHALGEKIGIRLELDHLVVFPRGSATMLDEDPQGYIATEVT